VWRPSIRSCYFCFVGLHYPIGNIFSKAILVGVMSDKVQLEDARVALLRSIGQGMQRIVQDMGQDQGEYGFPAMAPHTEQKTHEEELDAAH